ncbi:hypothetical protein [Trinickia dabaoshanensis]|uniref:hypothetical protein n=1 Tax=Trinickia dabaoshanensis TaxID=564714 RepID=UPI00130501F8|nr:hypothetical protein [Trinickia dabaoshanensis]
MEINTNYPKIALYSCDEPIEKLVVKATNRHSKMAAFAAFKDEVLAFERRFAGVGKRL